MKDYVLTTHALERLAERTSIKPEDFNSVMASAIEMPFVLSEGRRAMMFWSDSDDRAYLAYIQPKEDVVITIYEAYNFIDGQFVGKACVYRNADGRYDLNKAYRILRSDINYLLIKTGRGARPEFEKQPGEGVVSNTSKKIDYEIIASFNFYNATPKVRRIRQIPVGEDLALPYEGVLQDVAISMLTHNISTDGLVDVLVYAREPRRSYKAAGPAISTLEIEQLAIKAAINDLKDAMLDDAAVSDVNSKYAFLQIVEPAKENKPESMTDFIAVKKLQSVKANDLCF